jgi:hypothetical protein
LLNTKCVAAHQQAGDFQVVVQDGKIVQKNGGNVASYFCTPDGRVINAVPGPVAADDLLREAQWALDVYGSIESLPSRDRVTRLVEAHREALNQARDGQVQQAHRLLAERPLVELNAIYRQVFEQLGEGERAKGLESGEVLALQEENEDLKEELRQRTDGAGSAKALALEDENSRLRGRNQRLREEEEARKQARLRAETQALNWLRAAVTYLDTGKKEDQEAAKARLKTILERYPDTKAAQKAAEILASRLRSTN